MLLQKHLHAEYAVHMNSPEMNQFAASELHKASSDQDNSSAQSFNPFQSFMLGCWCLSALVDVLLVQVLHLLFEYEVKELPAGL